MDPSSHALEPALWSAHPNFSGIVNRNIIQSEIEGGVFLREVAPHTVLLIQTRNRVYTMVVLDHRHALISGHPEYCPEPTEVHVSGSTWGGSMIWEGFIGRGMFLEFHHPVHSNVRTTRILEIRSGTERDRAASGMLPAAFSGEGETTLSARLP